MRYRASVTFESDTQPPRVYRGEIVAGSAHTAASRALREARKEHKGVRYTSIAMVLEPVE